jgi:hypothetical protein
MRASWDDRYLTGYWHLIYFFQGKADQIEETMALKFDQSVFEELPAILDPARFESTPPLPERSTNTRRVSKSPLTWRAHISQAESSHAANPIKQSA